MVTAYQKGDTALGDQYRTLAQIKQDLADELSLQEQITEQTQEQNQNQQDWASGMQSFENNLASGYNNRLPPSPGYQQLLSEEFNPSRFTARQSA